MADDALTNLNWLMAGESPLGPQQNPPTPPTTPPDTDNNEYGQELPVTMMGDYNENYNRGFLEQRFVSRGTPANPTQSISFHHSFPPSRSDPNRKQHQGKEAAGEAAVDGPQIDYKSERVKPPYSYAQLISLAMQSHGGNKVVLTDIYVWIKDNFAYFRGTDSSWQNSIRHNLSLNRQFIKVPRDPDDKGKGSYWMLDPKSFRKDPYCIRRRNFFETHSKKPKQCVDRPQVNPAVKNFLEKARIRHHYSKQHPFAGTGEKLEDIGAQECVYSNAVVQHDDASGFNQKLFKKEVETYSTILSSGVVVNNNNNNNHLLHHGQQRSTNLPPASTQQQQQQQQQQTNNNNEIYIPHENDLIVTAFHETPTSTSTFSESTSALHETASSTSLPSDSPPLTTLVNVQQEHQQQPIPTSTTSLIEHQNNNGLATINSNHHYVTIHPESGSSTTNVVDGNNGGGERVKVEFNWEGYEYHPSNVLGAQLPTIHLSPNNGGGAVQTCGSLSPPNSDESDGGGGHHQHHHHQQGNNGTTTALDLQIPVPEIPDWWSSTGSITGGGLLSPPQPHISASNSNNAIINYGTNNTPSSSSASSGGIIGVGGDPLARVFELRQLNSTCSTSSVPSLSTPTPSSLSSSSYSSDSTMILTTVAAGTTTAAPPSTKMDSNDMAVPELSGGSDKSLHHNRSVSPMVDVVSAE